ncbi:AAA family ATPase [Streptosporangium sp. NPDC002524]|uniref:AAA family ATPase n=1 Tax=Streptosporangium sp. NPDC002524 TaxID=3154537 RepID=UPI003326EDBE
MPRLALYGLPGVGKSTFAHLLTKQLEAAGVSSAVVKIGAPLYELQTLIHTVAGRPLLTPTVQDGLLLGDLAEHLRRINPASLTDLFAAKVSAAPAETVLVCDDMRAPDVDALERLGFLLVEIHAPQEVRQGRGQARGDLTAGREDQPSEAPIHRTPYHRVANHGGLAALRGQAAALIERLEVKA